MDRLALRSLAYILADPQLVPGDTIVAGYSAVRGLWREILTTSPLLAIFARF
jgi:polysaccharide export outer membrane protein